MTSTGDEDLDIGNWLSAIHLERYQDSFKKHGYHMVKDILSIDNEILQKIGVSATGHRKRIISRLRHISEEDWLQSSSFSMEREDSLEFTSIEEKDNGITGKTISPATNEDIGNKVIPIGQNPSENKPVSEAAPKPVPKPRTVFNKSSTAQNKEYLVASSIISPTTSPSCLENHTSSTGKFFIQEAFNSSGSRLDSGDCNSIADHQPEGVGLETGTSLYSTAGVGKLFHPLPPRPMRQSKETSQLGSANHRNMLQMEADTIRRSPLSNLPSFVGNEEEVTSFSTSSTLPQETLTMISNEIYSGFNPENGVLNCATDKEKHRSNMNQKTDSATQEASSASHSIKSPQRRNSASLKPSQMRNTSSPTPGWIRDGVSTRPAPVGNSASPRTPRMRSSPTVRPVPVGNNTHLTTNQGKNIQQPTGHYATLTYTAASLRPTPVGDSGSPRLSRAIQTTFPRPPPIGHSASPRLPRLNSPLLLTSDSSKKDELPGTPSTNVTSSKPVKKKQETTGNTSPQKHIPVIRSTSQRPTPHGRKISTGNGTTGPQEMLHENSPRPSPVGNSGTGNIYLQKSSLMKYSVPLKCPVLKGSSSTYSCSQKTVLPPKLDEGEKYSITCGVVFDNHLSKRPPPTGISPSSTLQKATPGTTAPKLPSSKATLIKQSLTPKLKLGKLGLLNEGSQGTSAVSKIKSGIIEPRTRCILNAATEKLKGKKKDPPVGLVEVEHNSTERVKQSGKKLSPKQKSVEKCDLSIRKSASSVSFQRPKQTGNVGLYSKCKDVSRNSPGNVSLSGPVENAEITKRTSSSASTSPLLKVIKTIPSARPKQKDIVLPPKTKLVQKTTTVRPQPVGNVTSPKPREAIYTDSGKLTKKVVSTSPKTMASQLLPRLPFIQKKVPSKTELLKKSLSRAGNNEYLLCAPGRKVMYPDTISHSEDSHVTPPVEDFSPLSAIEESIDLDKVYGQSWNGNLTEKSLESALLRASSSAFKPIQNEHLVLVKPRLRGPHLNDSVIEQQYWTSNTKEGCLSPIDVNLPIVPERPTSTLVNSDAISPYCEAVFNRHPQPQQTKDKNSKVRTCATMPMFMPGEERGHLKSVNETGKERKSEEEEGMSQRITQIVHNELEGYSTVDAPPTSNRFSLPSHLYKDELLDDLTISPYASFTSVPDRSRPVLSGWLDKLSPQGNYVFQKRFVKFDGQNLMYFSNDKELYPKGVIPITSIEMARLSKDNKFEVVTKHRIFVFRTESEAQRNEWCSTIQNRVKEQRMLFPRTRTGCTFSCKRSGYLELKGNKSKIFAVLTADELWIHKNEQLYKMGIGMFVIEMHGSTIRCARNKTFELITPQKIFSFTAESEREKKEWMEALLECISESLSDYEVAEKIWSNKANKTCADCKAFNPDWASINLCVVICKQCAGQHRSLGTSISKVQSLKLDTSIWSNEIVQLFIILGNDRANRFWAAKLLPSEVLNHDDTTEKRRDFITQKYREGCFRATHPQYTKQEEILKALCTAVAGPNLLKSVMQFFCDAESLTDLKDSDTSTQSTQAAENWRSSNSSINIEGLVSDDLNNIRVYDEIMQPVVHSGYLNKTVVVSKTTVGKKTKDEFQKYWCVLERSLIFYESDKKSEVGKIEPSEVVCMGVNKLEALSSPSSVERYRYTFEIILSSEKLHQFGTDAAETLQTWTSAIGKWFTPLSCHCLLGHEFQRVGKMKYKAMLNPDHWMEGFFLLRKCHLFICPEDQGAAEDSVNLRQLQELTVSPLSENSEKKDILILVEKGRTLYLQGISRADFVAWSIDIQAAACSSGNILREQQLSRNDIPIIVDSCIAFLTQYGLRHEGIYRKNGAKSRIKLLMDEFRKDARNVKLRVSDNFIEDVTDVLKRFFRELDDPIFTTELHPQWKEAAEHSEKSKRLEKYMELINQLPKVNKATLTSLIGHLYRVQKCADLNQMCTKNLALLFAPSLFQTDGKGEHEVKVMEDLIDNYACVFCIDEEQVTQMDLEISLITTWKDVQLSQAGDLIIEVYLEKKLPDCCVTLKVSPVMTAEELTNQVLDMRNVSGSMDIWLTFEVFENGELERPLHPKEKVLEQALQWCKLAEPSSAFLLVKKIPIGEGSCLFTGAKRETPKCGLLKYREESPKLLGCKFQERYFVIRDRKLLMLKEKKSAKPEREWPLENAKAYMGIRKKLKPPSQWGFTIYLDKQQLCLCCIGQPEMWDWITSILKAQHDDLRPVILRRHSSSDVTKQKFGTMPLVPIRGDDTNATMVSANQTLRRLHTRRTLSMFFPMKMHNSLEELQEKQLDEEHEPVYEEVGAFQSKQQSEQECSLIAERQNVPPPLDRSKKPSLNPEQKKHATQTPPLPIIPTSPERLEKDDHNKTNSLDRNTCVDSLKTMSNDSLKFSIPDKGAGGTFGKTASLERQIEPSRIQTASARSQMVKSAVDLSSFPPLFFEPSSSFDAPKTPVWKKTSPMSANIQDKLLQELNTVISKKSDTGPGQQVT